MSKGKSLLSFFIPAAIIGAVLLLLAAAGFYWIGYKAPLEEQGRFYLQSSVNDKARNIVTEVKNLERQIDDAIRTSDGDREAIEAKILETVHGASALSFHKADDLMVNPEGSPAVTHVVFELLKKKAKGESIEPELILKDGSVQYVAFIGATANNQMLVLVAIKPESFNAYLGVVDQHLQVQLLQSHNDNAHLIAQKGSAGNSADKPLLSSNPFLTNWSVALWQAKNAFAPNFSIPLALLLMALGALVIGVLLPFFSLNKLLKTEARTFIKGISENTVKTNYKLNFFNELSASYKRVHSQGQMSSSTDNTKPEAAIEPAKNIAEVIDHSSDDSESYEKIEVDLMRVASQVNPDIFREYDIRGVAGESLNSDIMFTLGRAIGSEAYSRGEQKILVARDGRLSSPEYHEAVIQGLVSSGRDVIDLGMIPSPVLYCATVDLDVRSCVMITGSHNPSDHNGLKIVLAGESLYGRDIKAIHNRIKDNDLLKGDGQHKQLDFEQSYIDKVVSNIELSRPLKVIVDCGNGVTGAMVPRLLQGLGCEVVALHAEVDGNFPNHHPDPSVEKNLKDVVSMVRSEGADLGIAFDGDGDRVGIVDSSGKIIWTDRVMMLLASDILSRNLGAEIIHDVKCSHHLTDIIRNNQGVPIMWKTGHSLMKAKMQETGALLGGEGSGHIYIKERWNGFDDAIYAAARILELLAADVRPSAEVFEAFPESLSIDEFYLDVPDKVKFKLINALKEKAKFDAEHLVTIDGIRAEYENGWLLIRASNTSPSVYVKVEADNELILDRLKTKLKDQLHLIAPKMKLNF